MAYWHRMASTGVFALVASSSALACGGGSSEAKPCRTDDDCQLGGVPGMCVDGACGPVDPSAGDGSSTEATGEGSDSDGDSLGSESESAGEDAGESEESDSGETDVESDLGVEVERVDEGLVVFYALDEMNGTTVHDTAPVDPPIDLELEGDGWEWHDDGLFFLGFTETRAAAPLDLSHSKIINACNAEDAITLEAWVTPNEVLAAGPTRIVTFSRSTSVRNFLLGQGEDIDFVTEGYSVRLRTDSTDLNGLPALNASVDVNVQSPTHLLFVHRQDGSETFFVDGEAAAEGMRAGEFDFVGGDLRLALGNEHALDRAYTGEIHMVAIYCRALDDSEALQNFQAGI